MSLLILIHSSRDVSENASSLCYLRHDCYFQCFQCCGTGTAFPKTFPRETSKYMHGRIYRRSERVYVRARSFPAAAAAGVFLVTEIISPRAYKWIARERRRVFALADAPGPSSSTRAHFVGEIETRKRRRAEQVSRMRIRSWNLRRRVPSRRFYK